MKKILLSAALLCVLYVYGQQNIFGLVMDTAQQPVQYAVVQLVNYANIHTQTDSVGRFYLSIPDSIKIPFQVVVSRLGYISDTISVYHLNKLNITLTLKQNQEVIITEKQSSTIINTLPIREEIITQNEFRRAACCSVSESFETNPSVDVSFSDAASGIRQISLLGLSGKYTLSTVENLPLIRGLNIFSGFMDIPASWVEAIHVSKGVGSVLQGYEGLTGQIQVDFYCPESVEDKVFLRGYINHLLRSEFNANISHSLNTKLKGLSFLHAGTMPKSIDQNQDGFMDMSMHNIINALQKWFYEPNQKWQVKTGLHALYETRNSGQIHNKNFHHIANTYHIHVRNQRLDYYIKVARLFEKKGRSLAITYSGIHHGQVAEFGVQPYSGIQHFANLQSIYEEPIHSNHSLKFSAQYRYESIFEKNAYLYYQRIEHTFSTITEHTWKWQKKYILLTGLRADYHTLLGWFFTPRIHTKWNLSPQTTLRTVLGKATRIANIISENFNSLASSRVWIVQENLKPEVGWNVGLSFDQKFSLKNKDGRWAIESFYTFFKQQVIEDYDSTPQAIFFYNLRGRSYSFYVQTELEYEPLKNLTLKAAYKYYDVKITLQDKLMDRPFISKHRGLFTLSYLSSNEKWQFDATTQYHGRQRLPTTHNNPIQYQRPNYAPSYWLVLAQIQFISQKGLEIYAGGENLLNVRQPSPIISAENPYSIYFDTTLTYAPIVGRIIYLGLRWKW